MAERKSSIRMTKQTCKYCDAPAPEGVCEPCEEIERRLKHIPHYLDAFVERVRRKERRSVTLLSLATVLFWTLALFFIIATNYIYG